MEQALVAQAVRACRTCGCTDADCTDCFLRTGHRCFWVEDDLCSACRTWRPMSSLQARPGHIFVRTPNGDSLSWRWMAYRPGSNSPLGGRWQCANAYGFRNATLPKDGEWCPNPGMKRRTPK